MERVTQKMITFRHPFTIGGEHYPAGTYEVDTTEELLDGLSITGWRRTSTTIMPHASTTARRQVSEVDPDALEAALAADKEP